MYTIPSGEVFSDRKQTNKILVSGGSGTREGVYKTGDTAA
jgi:hypothetical protein